MNLCEKKDTRNEHKKISFISEKIHFLINPANVGSKRQATMVGSLRDIEHERKINEILISRLVHSVFRSDEKERKEFLKTRRAVERERKLIQSIFQ